MSNYTMKRKGWATTKLKIVKKKLKKNIFVFYSSELEVEVPNKS